MADTTPDAAENVPSSRRPTVTDRAPARWLAGSERVVVAERLEGATGTAASTRLS